MKIKSELYFPKSIVDIKLRYKIASKFRMIVQIKWKLRFSVLAFFITNEKQTHFVEFILFTIDYT
jgi:hypothetical protein